jgi:hypothetical protein
VTYFYPITKQFKVQTGVNYSLMHCSVVTSAAVWNFIRIHAIIDLLLV